MSSLDILYEDHRELLRISGELVAITRDFEPSLEQALMGCRHDLAKLVQVHLKREAELVLAPLRDSADPLHQALARRYIGDLLEMRLASTVHHGQWGITAARADMARYHVSVRALVKGLAARISWEEAELLPAAERLLAGRSGRRAV